MAESSPYGGLILSIARRSTPLWERSCPANSLAHNPKLSRDRRRRWCRILGSAELQRRRLRYSQLAPEQIEYLLGGEQGDAVLPSWTALLERWLGVLAGAANSGPKADRAIESDRPLPFEELLIDLVCIARAQAATRAGTDSEVMAAAASIALERQLLAHLCFVSNLTVGRDFYEFRFKQAPAAAIEKVWSRQVPSTEIYRAYLRHMRAGGLIELINRHPVLARLLCQSTEQWIEATANLCRRFGEDCLKLAAHFSCKVGPSRGALADIKTDLSDRHCGGLTVYECRLASGERVIYKPRTVQPEISFYGFLSHLNDLDLSLDLRIVRSIDRGSYGWMEHVAAERCNSEAEVRKYYRRAGMLLAALHVLAVTDIHCENSSPMGNIQSS